MTLRGRVRRRLREESKRAILRLLGRRVMCSECGRELFRTIPVVSRGKLKVFGSEYNVRVAFVERERLEFRHLELDQCPSAERPWVR